MVAVVETEVRAAGVSREVKIPRDREGAADHRSPVSVVRVAEDSPAASLSRVNADPADNRSRVAADFPVEGVSLEADKDSPAEAASPEADKGSRVAADFQAAGRDSPASAAFLAKDFGVAIAATSAVGIVVISGVAIADIIGAVIAGVDTMASPSAPTDTVMDTTRVTATTAAIMAGPIATPTATMISGAFGIQILFALTTLTTTDTATNGNHAPRQLKSNL
jgi:hypothetical protein